MDYLIYGADSKGSRTQLAHTPSARAAKAYRDSRNNSRTKVVVYGPEGELTENELDTLAAREDRLGMRY